MRVLQSSDAWWCRIISAQTMRNHQVPTNRCDRPHMVMDFICKNTRMRTVINYSMYVLCLRILLCRGRLTRVVSDPGSYRIGDSNLSRPGAPTFLSSLLLLRHDHFLRPRATIPRLRPLLNFPFISRLTYLGSSDLNRPPWSATGRPSRRLLPP